MKCWRINLHRNFSRYLDGELQLEEVKRLESHLLDCGWCRAQLSRMRDGQRLARQMPSPTLKNDPWTAIEKAISAESQNATVSAASAQLQEGWRGLIYRPGPLIVMTALAFLTALVIAVSTRPPIDELAANKGDLDTASFQAVTIANIHNNTRPHVVTEGFVSEVRIDTDGDLIFRLVEDLQRPEPFVICEIIPPIRLSPPALGSRVRVYGVSRYDNQPGREWYEVHPVLNIELVK
jgi:hypothetical protein